MISVTLEPQPITREMRMLINAIEVFCYRVAKYVGAYVAAMNGVDAIAFTAGIGENINMIREKDLLLILDILGVTIDDEG